MTVLFDLCELTSPTCDPETAILEALADSQTHPLGNALATLRLIYLRSDRPKALASGITITVDPAAVADPATPDGKNTIESLRRDCPSLRWTDAPAPASATRKRAPKRSPKRKTRP